MSSEIDKRKQFGERLRILRKIHGLTQAEFANRIQISQPGLGRYEAGLRVPDIFVTMKIVDEFGCSLEWLACGRGDAPLAKSRPFQ